MPKQNISTLKNWFKRGFKPLQQQFYDWMDSYWHKDDTLPISSISNLQATLNALPSQDAINGLLAIMLPDIKNVSTDLVYILPANKRLQSVIVIPSVDEIVRVGTTPGAEDIMITTSLTAGKAFVVDCAVYSVNDTSIYITGITGDTQIFIYKR